MVEVQFKGKEGFLKPVFCLFFWGGGVVCVFVFFVCFLFNFISIKGIFLQCYSTCYTIHVYSHIV